MNKKIIVFLISSQAILTLLFYGAYSLIITFFPSTLAHKTSLLTALLTTSFSFLVLSLATFNRDNFILRWLYVFSSIELIFVCYFAIASALFLFVHLIGLISLNLAGNLALATSIVITVYGIINARMVSITTVNIKLPNLPEFWQGKTAVVVSDTHLGQILRTGFASKVVKRINSLKPEIVLIPGDFYDGVHTDFQALANEFKKITAPFGVYFSSGNHELFAGYQKCETALRQAGIKILENTKVEINGLQIAGVAYKKDIMEDLSQTLCSLGLDLSKPSILLKHVPLQIAEVAKAGVNLMFSGHTHHGQLWPGNHITKAYFKGFNYGLKSLDALQVYTTSGVGSWGPPVRVFAKSEIVKVILE